MYNESLETYIPIQSFTIPKQNTFSFFFWFSDEKKEISVTPTHVHYQVNNAGDSGQIKVSHTTSMHHENHGRSDQKVSIYFFF